MISNLPNGVTEADIDRSQGFDWREEHDRRADIEGDRAYDERRDRELEDERCATGGRE